MEKSKCLREPANIPHPATSSDHAGYVTQTFQRNSARLESQPFGPIEIEDCGLVTARREVDPPRAPSSITRLPKPWKRDFEL